MAQPFAGSHVPVSELFFSGGGSTLRGFPSERSRARNMMFLFAAIQPTLRLVHGSPYRKEEGNCSSSIPKFAFLFPSKKALALPLFMMVATCFQHVGFSDFRGNYTNTVGIGLRYSTPVGPVRINLGRNLNALPGIKSTQIFITLGQAF